MFAPSLEVQKRSNMFAVQLLRVSVHERIGAAAEDFLLQVEKGEEAARVPALRALLTERLTAAAEEIVGLLEETVAEYEDRVERSEREICRQRRLLDAVLKPEVRLHRADVQLLMVGKEEFPPEQQQWSTSVKEEPEPPHIKEEQEELEPPHIKEEQEDVWSSKEGKQLQWLEEANIIKFIVKSEEDEEKPQSSQLHQSQSEEKREDCGGPEPARNSGPGGHLEPGPEDQTEDSSEPHTQNSVDWKETREPQSDLNKKSIKQSVSGMRYKADNKSFCCSECGKRFSQKKTLQLHMRIHRGQKPLSCAECDKTFHRKVDMKRHILIHTGEKPFNCPECGNKFRLKGNLLRHIRIHTEEKKFSCSECGQRFRLKGVLLRHMMIHTGEKPFSCSECGKRFRQKIQLKSHMKIHTGEKPFSCRVCNKRFTWNYQQKKHQCVVESSKPQSQTEEIKEDCGGPEPPRNSGPDDQTEDSSEPETEDSGAWKEAREQSGSKTLKNSKVSAGDLKRSSGEKPFS
ncbi:hypothetical protein F2P81_022901 [Scophthalmus maximus]|uniref:C2H2-type domain-containing protein n=1 Tax=Scophthalmus maximus TaxID=52904 RepID=A0A6A4RUZ2_SCOMX|nr:hypothetical protein F2P81_022901 [Scophthalmus maximus]